MNRISGKRYAECVGINWCNSLRIKRLKWDKGNIFHIARHGITVKDVEDACSGRHIARKEK